MADYKTPQWLLPNEKNLAYPAAGAETGSGLSEDRHSLYSMDFNGTDYISAPNTFLNSASVCTLSFWMKGTGEVGGGAPWNGIQIQAGVSTTSFRTMNGSNVNNYVSFSPGTDWHHYLGVYVGGSYSKLYIDGVLKSTLSTGIPTTLASTSGDIFKIGYGQSYSVAKIDEVAIWNRQLTDGGVADGVTAGGEIATIYNSGAPGNLMGLNEKPIAYYPLGEQAQMGSANWSFPNGSLQSHAIEFDGTSDYITTPSFTTSGDDLTISVWLKAANLTSGTSSILFGNNSNFIRYNLNEVIYARINGTDAYIITNLGGVPEIFGTGNWHHLAVVKSGSTVTWYIDGNPYTTLGSGTTGGFTMNYIGANGSALNEFLDGQLSNVAIWNSDQSANIDNIYNNGSPQSTYTVTPTAWWKLNAANSSYVYPWLISMTGDTDYGSGNGCFTTGGVLKWIDTQSQLLSEDEYFTFTTQEVSYSGSITLSTTGGNYQSASSQLEYSLEYKVDQGSWTVWKTQVVSSGTSNTAWTATDVVVNPTSSVQVRLRATGGLFGSSQFTLNDITIGGLYTETFATADIGYTNNTITQPPVDWTFIDTETPAPNYTSALNFPGGTDYIDFGTGFPTTLGASATAATASGWVKINDLTQKQALFNITTSGGNYFGSFAIWHDPASNKLYAYINGNANNIYLSSGITDNNWHHLAVVYDQSAGATITDGLKLYLDGSPVTPTASAGSTPAFVDFTASLITRLGWGWSNTFTAVAEMSNWAMWNSALTAGNITTLYNNGTPETTISLSPTSYYKLDNITTGIQDAGSSSNNGTITGSVTQVATNVLVSNNGESDTLPTSALTPSDLQFESPYSNYSLDFDGTDDYVDLGDLSSIGISNASAASVSMWFKKDGNGNYILFELKEGSSRIAIQSYLSNSLYIYINSVSYNVATTVANNEWHNITLAFDGTKASNAGRLKLYFNGSNITGGTYSGTVPTAVGAFTSSMTSNLGRTPTTAYFDGKIDETAIWSSALNQAQVSQVYNNGYPADLTSLSPASWWRLGEDAYFVSNVVTIPNKITSGPNGTGGGGDQSAFLVGEAPGSYANGSGTNLVVTDRIGDAPESTANSVSINMIPSNRISYPAGYVPTQVDNAFSMEFDGVNDYFDADISTLNNATALTFSVWVKKTSGNVVGFESFVSSTDRVILYWWSDNNVYWSVRNGSASAAASSSLTTYDWNHIAGTFEGSTNTIKLYINGSLVDTQTGQPSSTSGNLSNNFHIGLSNGSTYNNGNIDEVAIFDYALSARQIKQDIYEGTTTGGKTADLNNISNLTAPVAWYRMGD